jgi:hypothetical protein
MLSQAEWKLVDHRSPAYVGKHRNELWRGRDAQYGKGNWQTIWLVGGNYLEYEEACRLYEDAYFEYFKQRPELLEYLLEVARMFMTMIRVMWSLAWIILNAATSGRTYKILRFESV